MMSPYLRRRIYAALGLVLCTMGILWAGRTFEARQARLKSEKEAADLLFACDDQVVGFEIGTPQDASRSIIVAKRARAGAPYDANTPWRLEAPLSAMADQAASDAVVEAACALKRSQTIAAKEGEPPLTLSAFGLAPARKTLLLIGKDGSAQRLDVGDASAFNQTMYVRRVIDNANDAPVIDLIEQGFSFQVDRDAMSLREKRILQLKNADVSHIQVATRSAPGFHVEQADHGRYLLWQHSDKDQPLDGDPQAVGTFIDALVNLRAKSFLDEAPAPARLKNFALDPPTYQVTLGASDPNDRVLVRLGAMTVGQEQHVFAQVGAPSAPIVEVEAPSVVDKFKDGGLGLRDMRMLRAPSGDVRRIDIEKDGQTLVLVRQEEELSKWSLAQNRDLALDSSKISSMLYKLTHLRADTLALSGADNDEIAAAKLDSPELSVKLLDGKGDSLGHLRVGAEVAERRAAIGDGGRIGQIFASATEGISSHSDDYTATK